MHPGIIFAILCALVFGLWTVFHDQAAASINSLFGAIIVSATAALLGLILFLPTMKGVTLVSNPKGLLFAVLAGVTALGIDYFALKAYGSGLEVSVAGPIIIGGSIATATIIGFFLGDSVTITKILALILVLAGSVLLAYAGK